MLSNTIQTTTARALVVLVIIAVSTLSLAGNGGTGMEKLAFQSRGPWGELDVIPLLLEPSDYFVSLCPDLQKYREGVVWCLMETEEEDVSRIMRDVGFDQNWIGRLLGPECLSRRNDIIEIRPPEDVLLGLTPRQRDMFYRHLEMGWEGCPYTGAYVLMPGGIRKAAREESGISEELLDLISQLSFQRGLTTRFCDIRFVLSKAASDTERIRIVKTLLRNESLSVQVCVDSRMDRGRLREFWSSEGRNGETGPFLDSVLSNPRVSKIDVVHLLPSLPRRLLNTYYRTDSWWIKSETPDCFWTAFSFFSKDPPDRHLDFVGHIFEERYEVALPPYLPGDVIIIAEKESGRWIHACNYLAGNLVFTKNGKSAGRPWVIQSLDEVVTHYLKVEVGNVSVFRLRSQYRQ